MPSPGPSVPPDKDIYKGILTTAATLEAASKENDRYMRALDRLVPIKTRNDFIHEMAGYIPTDLSALVANGKYTLIAHKGGNAYTFCIGSRKYDIDDYEISSTGKYVVLLTQRNPAREDNELLVFKEDRLVAKIKSVSKEFLIVDNYLYYVGESTSPIYKKYHHYDTLYRTLLHNPVDAEVLFTRNDPHHTIRLATDADKLPYMVLTTYDPVKTLIRSLPALVLVHDRFHINNDCSFLLNEKSALPEPHDKLAWACPGYRIYVNRGEAELRDRKGNSLVSCLGWIDPFGRLKGVFIIRPVNGLAWVWDNGVVTQYTTTPREIPAYVVKTENYPPCPIITVAGAGGTATKTLIVFYGAYGLRTRTVTPYMSWGSLLTRDWRVCYVLAPGGGDDGAAWTGLGRKTYHHATVDAVEAASKWIMRTYKCPWERTAIYARSAGGIPAGILTIRGTVGISWMEHPFVDVVATMSNPALPLTGVEYDEFGNPAESGAMTKMIAISPVNAPARIGKRPKVLLRSGCEDTQVYCYEPLKFADRLRGELGFEEVFCPVEAGEGHFYSEDAWLKARGADMALLDCWAEADIYSNMPLNSRKINEAGVKKISLRGIKEMVKTHRNKSARRNKNSRRNKNMEGGKRKTRRSKATRRRRVARKH
jgi:hypothetical protein